MRRAKKHGIYHRVLGVILSLCARIPVSRGWPMEEKKAEYYKGKEVKGKLEKKKEE